ncbi:MAG: hypothetical protein FK734_03435 [Asgard group archaeon]|nr:hypothetical protein [Asgard group archaeon]
MRLKFTFDKIIVGVLAIGFLLPMFSIVIQENIGSIPHKQYITGLSGSPITDAIEPKANYPPTLLSPTTASEFKDRTPTLEWSEVYLANSYHLVVARDSGFTDVVVDLNTPITDYTCPTLADDWYYWHVQARDEMLNEWGAYSTTWTFKVDNVAPLCPNLWDPEEDELFTYNEITFRWQPIPDAYIYWLQVDDNNIFAFPFVSVETTETTYTVSISEGTRWWRVCCRDLAGNWALWDEEWSFTIDITPPGTPTLLSPASGSVFTDTTPELSWTAATDAYSYQIQFSYNSAFTDIVYTTSTGGSTSYTSITLADDQYYWRVRARDEAGNFGSYSAAWSFTIDTTPPDGPTLLSPEDGFLSSDDEHTFTWSPNGGSNYYHFQLDNSVNFDSPIADTYLTTTSYTRSSMSEGYYYWRVKARDPVGNWGDWSEIRQLRIDTTPPLIYGVSYSPDPANDIDDVYIHCSVFDANLVSTVQVYYRVNGGDWIVEDMSWTSGYNYEVLIGSFDYNDFIEFYIYAEDYTAPTPHSTIEDNEGLYYCFAIEASDNTGPTIYGLVYIPENPTSAEAVFVMCYATDEHGVSFVTLYYRINGGSWIGVNMTADYPNKYETYIGPLNYLDEYEFYIEAVDDYATHNSAIDDNDGFYYSFTVRHPDVTPPTISYLDYYTYIIASKVYVSIDFIVSDDSGVNYTTFVFRFNGGAWFAINLTSYADSNYHTGFVDCIYNDLIEFYFIICDNSPNYNVAIDDNDGSYYGVLIPHGDIIGPTINDVEHSPSNPNDADSITISCNVTDANDVLFVTLVYRLNGGSWIEVNMTLTTDSIYCYTIGVYNFGDYLEYYILAVDSSPNNNEATNDNDGSYYGFTIASSDVTGPVISDITQSANITAGVLVNITCSVYDINGIQSVMFYYRLNNGIWITLEMVLLYDNTYGIIIGAFVVGDLIDYYITAIDNSPNHNSAIDDNDGLYYSFEIESTPTVTTSLSYLLPLVSILALILIRRKKF